MRGLVVALAMSFVVPALAEDRAEDAEQPRLLVLDLKSSRKDRGAARAITARLTHGLAERLASVTVYSTSDLARLADLEVEKQRLGCDTEEASCLAELADAFGAKFVSYGNIGSVGRGRFLEITVVDVAAARPVERIFLNAADAGGLLEGLEGELEKAARSVRQYLGFEDAKPRPKRKKKPARKKLTERDAKVAEAHRLQTRRVQRKLQDLESRYAMEIAGATTTFVVGGLATGTCATICGVGSLLSGTTDRLSPQPLNTGSELVVCGGVGTGVSLLSTLGLGIWQLSAASETADELQVAKRNAERLNRYSY